MGNPVSTVTANLYMEEFEERAIETATYKPKTADDRLDYADDRLCR